ncbi:hypothetical protein ACFWY9_20625 [Amycolatopsis sp. NPDC059027]|uniref:hypothetical protein n=1 Tax=Amycolatopsis sp. NPDC059027 TaxID=3346709 RepID=UPI003670AFA7
MRGAENVVRRHEAGRQEFGAMPPPRSFGIYPKPFTPHPPLVSGGWYQGAGREVVGPGRYPVDRPAGKSAGAALLWTVVFGPLGLCYFSVAGGLVAAAVAAAIVIAAGSAVLLAVIWPVSMVLALVAVPWH